MATKESLYMLPAATLRARLAPLEMLRGGTRAELVERLWAAINLYDNEYDSDGENWENTDTERLIAECRARGLRIKGSVADMRARIRQDHNRRKQYAVPPTPSMHRISKQRHTRRRPLLSPRTTPDRPLERCGCSCRYEGCRCTGPSPASSWYHDDTSMEDPHTGTNSARTRSLRSASDVSMEELARRNFNVRTPSDTFMEDPMSAANSRPTSSYRTTSEVDMELEADPFTTYRERVPSLSSGSDHDRPFTMPTPPLTPTPSPPRAAGKRARSYVGVDSDEEEQEQGRPRRSKRLMNRRAAAAATNAAPSGGLDKSYRPARTTRGARNTRAAPYNLRSLVVPGTRA